MDGFYKLYFDSSMDLMCVARHDGFFTAVNKAWTDTLGWTSQELISRSFLDLIHPEDLESTKMELVKLQNTNHHTKNFSNRYRHKDGSYHWLMWTAMMSPTEETIFATARDITEQRRLTQELSEARAQIISASKISALGEMAGGIAHEINNPLAIIKGAADILEQLLEKGVPNQEDVLLNLTAKIQRTTERVARIVNGLRSFTRDAQHDPMELVNLEMLVQDSLEFCRTRLFQYNIGLRITNIGGGIKIHCKPVQLSQVLLNLIDNSIDAVKESENPWIEIAAQDQEDKILLTVTDSGTGIKKDLEKKIMEPFFTTKALGKGTGLGLSISKRIIQNHGGSLLYNPESRHTQFIIELQNSVSL